MDIKQTVTDMLKIPQLASVATITLDFKPWTRYMMINSDENFIIRTTSFVNSRKVKQIEKNPEVHLTFGVNDPMTEMGKPYVQIQGIAKISTDPEEKNKQWNDMLAKYFSGPEDPNYVVMIVEPYRVEYTSSGEKTPEVWEK